MTATEANTPTVKVDPKEGTAPEVTVATPDFPAAGPHARPELNDAMKTPGAGMLNDPDQSETDAPGG